jgi:hypothetical protein
MTSAAHYPWLVFALITPIMLAAASQLAGLRIEIAAQGLMVSQPTLLAEHNAGLKAFGSDAIRSPPTENAHSVSDRGKKSPRPVRLLSR